MSRRYTCNHCGTAIKPVYKTVPEGLSRDQTDNPALYPPTEQTHVWEHVFPDRRYRHNISPRDPWSFEDYASMTLYAQTNSMAATENALEVISALFTRPPHQS